MPTNNLPESSGRVFGNAWAETCFEEPHAFFVFFLASFAVAAGGEEAELHMRDCRCYGPSVGRLYPERYSGGGEFHASKFHLIYIYGAQ